MELFRHVDPRGGSPVRWIALILLAVAAPRAAAQFTGSATEIAITGASIPGTAGNAFISFEASNINNVGQIAFVGEFPGGMGVFSVNGAPVNTYPSQTNAALQVNLSTPGATFPSVPVLRSIELTGQTPSEAHANATGDRFISFNTIVGLNNTTNANGNTYGAMTLQGNLNPTPTTGQAPFQGNYGVGFPSQHNPVELAYTGQPAPGTATTFAGLAAPGTPPLSPVAIDDNNAAAFVANLNNGDQGLYLATVPNSGGASAVTLVAEAGFFNNTAPGTNNKFTTFTGPVSLVSIANSGTNFIAFQASITTNGIANNAIFSGAIGSVTVLAQTGTASPVSGWTFASFSDPVSLGAFNNGQAAFRATIQQTNGTNTITAAGLFLGANGSSIAIGATNGLVGTPLPSGYSTTFPNGATYIGFGGVAQSLDGQLAFVATLDPTGIPGGGAGGGGIFLSKGTSTVTHIAVSGDFAPGAGGAKYASFFNTTNSVFNTIFDNTSVAINDHQGTNQSHEVAFQAFLAGNGVNGSNNVGLFIANDQVINPLVDPNKTETVMLARTGQQITTNPGVTKTINSFLGFYTRTGNGTNSFNDLGELTAVVNFVEGGSGVYVFAPDLHLSQFTPLTSPVAWGNPGTTANPAWTFNYSPANQVYRVVIDPADVGLNAITVSGPTAAQSLPSLQVSSNTGVATFAMQPNVTLTLGGGAITSGVNVLTVQGPSSITGAGALLKLLGDVTSLAASGTVSNAGVFTAVVAPDFDLGNVPYPITVPSFTTPPPSTADVDRFRTFNVARGNFVGAYPIDLFLPGNIISPNETVTLADSSGAAGSTVTNDVHRGLLKTGSGILRLTGLNNFGPDTTITDDPYTTGVLIGTQQVSFVQSLVVKGGLVSFANDGNLGLAPATPTSTYWRRWITLDGGGIGLQTTATSNLANPTIIDPDRGIAVGPVTGFGIGVIDVFGTNVLDYEGVVADNTDNITMGVGTLVKTGTGTLILSGTTNSYRGGTIVNNGTLRAINDGALGAGGTAVTVNAPGTLTYYGTGNMPTARTFTLNGGTLSVASPTGTVTFVNTTVTGGFLSGPGAFATVAGGSTTFTNTTTNPSASLTLNGADTLANVSNGGSLTVAGGLSNPATFTHVTNLGSGSITVTQNSQLLVSDFQSNGTLTLAPGSFNGTTGSVTLMTNVGSSPLSFAAGSRTFLSTVAQVGNLNAGIDLNGNNAIVTGGLFVNNGFVFDSTGTHHRVVADYGSLVKGAGFYETLPQTVNGGTFQVGNSPGRATTGTIVLGGPADPAGGLSNYTWQINDAGPSSSFPTAPGVSGPTANAASQVSGWGLLVAVQRVSPPPVTNGNFQWDATSTDQFTIHLQTLLAPNDANGNPVAGGGYEPTGDNTAGLMGHFDPNLSYTWRLFQYQGTYSGPTDSATLDASTIFDASGFLNTHPGRFDWVLNQAAKEMDLVYTPTAVPEPGTLSLVGLVGLAAGWRLRRARRVA
jgi:fibronectin-binding autotransporter adhesin